MAHHASATALKSKCPKDGTASLCANGCGFYGTAATGNMCSKCYKEHAVAASNTTAKTSVFVPEVSTAPPENKAKTSVFVPEVSTAPPENKAKTIVSDTSSDGGEPSVASTKTQPIVATNRCATCRKKVGLLGFRCRCEGTFCSVHRYSDKHDCGFDYKTAGREQIVKNNPIVLADKMATRI